MLFNNVLEISRIKINKIYVLLLETTFLICSFVEYENFLGALGEPE